MIFSLLWSTKTVDLHNCAKVIFIVFIGFSKCFLLLLSQHPYVTQCILPSNFLLGYPSQKWTPVQDNLLGNIIEMPVSVSSLHSLQSDLPNSLRSFNVLLKNLNSCLPSLHFFFLQNYLLLLMIEVYFYLVLSSLVMHRRH